MIARQPLPRLATVALRPAGARPGIPRQRGAAAVRDGRPRRRERSRGLRADRCGRRRQRRQQRVRRGGRGEASRPARGGRRRRLLVAAGAPHARGARSRLRDDRERFDVAGFTHYVRATERRLVRHRRGAGILRHRSASSTWSPACAVAAPGTPTCDRVARQFPTLPILRPPPRGVAPEPDGDDRPGRARARSAAEPNILVKVSGFHYVSDARLGLSLRRRPPGVPPAPARVRSAPARAGARTSRPRAGFLTYTQSLEVVRSHCDFLDAGDRALVLGENLARVLDTRSVWPPHPPATEGTRHGRHAHREVPRLRRQRRARREGTHPDGRAGQGRRARLPALPGEQVHRGREPLPPLRGLRRRGGAAAHRETPHFKEIVEGEIVPLLDSREREVYTQVVA